MGRALSGPAAGSIDPRRTALLVVDLQNDFCSQQGFFGRQGLDVSGSAAVIERTNRLLEAIRPLGVHVVFTKSVRRDPPPQKLAPSRPFYGGGAPLAAGTWGSELVDAIVPGPGDVVLEKPRYSAFCRTSLENDLRRRGIDTVALAGMTTNCCIDSTMRDAYMRDFDVIVLADAVAGFGGERTLHDATLRNAELLFGVVATADELAAALSVGTPASA